ncbi:MAG: lytic transglycosylase domain-containing protein [Acidimicrobiales bacterium]
MPHPWSAARPARRHRRAALAVGVAVALGAGGVLPAAAQTGPTSSSTTTTAPPTSTTTTPPTSTTAAPTAPPSGPTTAPPPSAPPLTPEDGPTTTARSGSGRPPPAPTTSLPPSAATTAPVVVVDDPRVLPELGAVGLDSPEYNLAVAGYLDVQAREQEQADAYDKAVASLRDLVLADQRLRGDVAQATRRQAKAATRLAELRAELRNLAVDQYVAGGIGGPPEESLDLAGTTEQGRRRVLVDAVQGRRLDELRTTADALRIADQTLASTSAELAELDHRRQDDERTRDRAAVERDRLTIDLGLRRRAVADTRLLAAVVGLDFPLVVLNAYVSAAKVLAVTQPECGIHWTALAGIGRTESRHGTFNDSRVDADGHISPPIYGIALDGSGGTAAIGDSDLGLLDGDPNVDRAVGPMQFIPTTWVKFAKDGNRDGTIDPQNIYDAALTAGVYLCRQGPGLDTDEGLRRAFRSYNNDGSYVELVLSRAHTYDEFTVPSVPGAPLVPPPLPKPPPETTTSSSSSTTSTTAGSGDG